ncbi:MAG TPA: hypothetical protein VF534_04410 [Paraburkholderia sp.]
MKERPILFSGAMVRALLRDVNPKSQTRRVVMPQPAGRFLSLLKRKLRSENDQPVLRAWFRAGPGEQSTREVTCPYGESGDRLWVRETCRAEELETGLDGVRYAADDAFRPIANSIEAAERWIDLNAYRGKSGAVVPAIHMPRWASRITLEVTGVRVERLKDISAADARAEGIEFQEHRIAGDICRSWKAYGSANGWFPEGRDIAPIHSFQTLWDSLNAERGYGWAANPWVWVVEFKRIEI